MAPARSATAASGDLVASIGGRGVRHRSHRESPDCHGRVAAAGMEDCAVLGRLGMYTMIRLYADFVVATTQVGGSPSTHLFYSLCLPHCPSLAHSFPVSNKVL